MTLQDIASIALVFSATGMMLSAIFVGFQLRSSVRLFRIQQREARARGLAEYKLMALDPAVAGLILRARADYGALTEAEKLSFESYLEVAMSSITSLHLIPAVSSVGAEAAQAFAMRHVIGLMDHPGTRAWWAERRTKAMIGGPARELIDAAIGADGRKTVVVVAHPAA